MTDQRRFYGNVGSLGVADFPDQENIRVLAQNDPDRQGEGQPAPWIDVHLRNAVQAILDGFFNGNDVGVDPIQTG